MRNAFIATIHDLCKADPDIVIMVADNGAIVFDQFRAEFPGRFINCGIAEANMIGVAAGMALSGKKPYIYTITNFMTMRAFEQIRNDICLQHTNVKVVGIGGGFVYSTLGPTHHAIEDISLMRSLPNMTVICPASPLEVQWAVKAIVSLDTPVYLRMGTNREPEIYDGPNSFETGKGVLLREGGDLTIIVTGPLAHDVLEAHKILNDKGIQARIINMHTIKPIDREMIIKAATETHAILTVENHNIIGGLGSAVAEVLAEFSINKVKFKRLGIPDEFCLQYGTHDELKRYYQLDASSIAQQAETFLKK